MIKEDQHEATAQIPCRDHEAIRTEQMERTIACAALLNAMKAKLKVGGDPWQICREVTEKIHLKCC